MGSTSTISIILSLVDNASAAFSSAGASLKKTGESLTSIGTTLSTSVTLPLAGLGYAAMKTSTDFQAAMTQLVTQAGLPQDALKGLTDQVLAFASSGAQQGPEVLAQGLYHIISLGVPAKDAMGVLKDASMGAAMSGANLEDVSNALGAAVASNIKGSGDYNQAMAILNATVGAGNMRMGDLAQSLGNVLPQATTAGLSLTDVGAAMATMTDNGMPAADAATRLHMAISLMAAPTKQATGALASIGITQLQLADDMRNKGLLPALQDLKSNLEDAGLSANQQAAVLSQAFGGGRSAGAIELLLNNLDRVKQKYEAIGSSTGKFASEYATEQQTTAATFAEAQAQMSAAMVKLGDAIAPVIVSILPKLVSGLTSIINAFTHLPSGVQTGIIVFLGLFAALGPVIIVVGQLITVVGALSTLFAGVTMAAAAPYLMFIAIGIVVAALAYIIITHWTQIAQFTESVWGAIVSFFKSTWDTLKSGFTDALNGLLDILNAVGGAISDALKFLVDFWVGFIILALNGLFPGWQKGLEALLTELNKVWDAVKAATQAAFDWVAGFINTTLTSIQTVWNSVWGGLSSFLTGIWDGIKKEVQDAVNFITGLVNQLFSTVSSITGQIMGPINAVAGAVSGALSTAGNIIKGIANVGANVTKLASGGIVNGPTFALVGEAGPEAVIPLSMLGKTGGTMGGMGAGGSGNIIVNVNGGSYLDDNAALDFGNKLARIIGQQVKLRTI